MWLCNGRDYVIDMVIHMVIELIWLYIYNECGHARVMGVVYMYNGCG